MREDVMTKAAEQLNAQLNISDAGQCRASVNTPKTEGPADMLGRLEPGLAVHPYDPRTFFLASIAISLKRIAHALEDIANAV
jgi:hypothetical protein